MQSERERGFSMNIGKQKRSAFHLDTPSRWTGYLHLLISCNDSLRFASGIGYELETGRGQVPVKHFQPFSRVGLSKPSSRLSVAPIASLRGGSRRFLTAFQTARFRSKASRLDGMKEAMTR